MQSGSWLSDTWDLETDEEVIRVRQVYRVVHFSVQIGAITAFLEELFPPETPLNIIRQIAVEYYKTGGSIQELETTVQPPYLGWDHPALWFPQNNDIPLE